VAVAEVRAARVVRVMAAGWRASACSDLRTASRPSSRPRWWAAASGTSRPR